MIQNRKTIGVKGRIFVVCCCFGLLLTANVTAVRAGGNKVGIIDTAKVLLQSKYAMKLKAEFAVEMENQRRELDRKREEVIKLQERLQEAKTSGKRESSFEKAQEELERSIRELKWMKEDLDQELLEKDKELTEKVRKRVRLVLDQFVTLTEYCIIIEKHRVAVYCDSADVTDEIIKRLDSYRD